MSDNPNGTGAATPPQTVPHPPFPGVRVLWAIGYGILAYFVLHVLFCIALVQLAMLAVNGRVNDELKGFSINLVQYLWELVAFVVFARDEQPFPVGPFPRHA